MCRGLTPGVAWSSSSRQSGKVPAAIANLPYAALFPSPAPFPLPLWRAVRGPYRCRGVRPVYDLLGGLLLARGQPLGGAALVVALGLLPLGHLRRAPRQADAWDERGQVDDRR